jgi:hypothetical protein
MDATGIDVCDFFLPVPREVLRSGLMAGASPG